MNRWAALGMSVVLIAVVLFQDVAFCQDGPGLATAWINTGTSLQNFSFLCMRMISSD
jgi:hypothetical protein